MAFIKLPRQKQFKYRPRHFDPERDELQKKLRNSAALDDSELNIRSSFTRLRKERQDLNAKADLMRKFIFLITISLLLVVVYLVFKFTNLLNIFF